MASMAARRSARRKDWPRGLYESKPGYFVWRNPVTGAALAIGRVPLATAKQEAIAANAFVAEQQPTLVDQLSGSAKTLGDLLEKMRPAKAANTARAWRSLDKIIRDKLSAITCGALTVENCSDVLEEIIEAGKLRSAEAVRARLVQVCRRGLQLGWMDANPAEVTDTPDVTVKRGRLTLATFQAIYDKAPLVNPWLQRAMMFGLVLGADRISIVRLERANVTDGLLTYRRSKTGAWIAVPLLLRMNAVGVSLADLVSARGKVLSPYLLHHPKTQGQASAGDPVHPDTLSEAFTKARALAGIPDEGAPTFHELRSLCKRTYEAQGGVDTRALLGHAGERVSELYADPRGVEPVRVKLG